MNNFIKLTLPKNRYKGISKSGNCYNFITRMNGGKWFSIPIYTVTHLDLEFNQGRDIQIVFTKPENFPETNGAKILESLETIKDNFEIL